MASKGKYQPKKVKKKNNYEMPKPLKAGELIVDNQKNQWKIGVSIGIGGFGEIYSACKAGDVKKVDDYPFVVKIEPKENGPLFVEMHFYMRNAKSEDIDKFKKDRKLKSFGMPEFIAAGSHEIQQMKHRFIVLPRFGRDIWKIFIEQGRKFPLHTVYRIGWQILNVLEYVHQKKYVHGDIKGSNILLGFGKGGDEQVNLLDFGLTCHYNTKVFKPDPKKMHNGTIEYTSRDAHQGVSTMRGDIEILIYNLIELAGAKLPWVEKNILGKPVEVQNLKEEFLKYSDKSLRSCFGSIPVPPPFNNLLGYLASMKHDTVPEYSKIRGILETGVKDLGQKNSGVLQFVESIIPVSLSEKVSFGRPCFGKKVYAQKDNCDNNQPGPSRKLRTVKRVAKNYAEVDSEDNDVELEKDTSHKKTPKKKSTSNTAKAEAPLIQDEQKTGKRNRQRKQYFENSENENEADEEEQSPKKRTKAETQPSQKKESSKTDTERSTFTLKGRTNKSSKGKKTYHLNFNLDVSLNSDVVVVLNRKDRQKVEKPKPSDEEENEDENEEDKTEQKNRAGIYKGKKAKA